MKDYCIGVKGRAVRRRGIGVILSALLTVLAFGMTISLLPAYGAEANTPSTSIVVKINGMNTGFSVDAIAKSGATLAPARALLEALGCEVAWSPDRKEISANQNGNDLVLWVGSKTAFYNSKLVMLPEPVVFIGGKTMVPLRAVAEAMGATVNFDSDLREINLKAKNSTSVSEGAILTYAKANELARRASSSYSSALISYEKVKERNSNLELVTGTYNLAMLQSKKGLTLEETWTVMNLAIMEEQIAMDIRSKMDTLTLKEKDLALLKEKNAISREKARIAELKYECGQLSKVALNDARTERDLGFQSADVMEKEINTAYAELNTALGKPLDGRPSLEYKVTFGAIGKVDLDSKIRQDKAADPYLWLSRQQKDLAEFNLNTFEYNSGSSSWTLTKLDLSQARLNLSTSEDNFGKTVQSRYDQLLIMETNLKSLDLSLEQAKNAFYQARVKYDLGYMVKVDLEDARRGVRDAELKREKLFQQYRDVMLTFDKPYLSPVYISSK